MLNEKENQKPFCHNLQIFSEHNSNYLVQSHVSFLTEAVGGSCCKNGKSSYPLPPFLCRHVYTVCIMCSPETTGISQ